MKKIVILFMTIAVVIMATGCNYDFVDTNYNFDYAIIQLQNGEIVEGYIDCWRDAEDGEQLTITMKDGTKYLTNSFNCTLVER